MEIKITSAKRMIAALALCSTLAFALAACSPSVSASNSTSTNDNASTSSVVAGDDVDLVTWAENHATSTVAEDNCQTCHGVAGFHARPSDHDSYTSEMCTSCHKYVEYGYNFADNAAPVIPHDIQNCD